MPRTMMADNHIEEPELDRLARRTLTGDDLQLGEHLRTCSACARRFSFLLEFYTRLREELRFHTEDRVNILSARFIAERVMLLRPFPPAVQVTGAGPLLFQAQTYSEETSRFATVATFAIESTHVLARIVKDRMEHRHRVYVLAEDPELKRHVLVGVGGAALRSPLIPTDAEGMATVTLDEARDWSSSYVVVVAPLATFRLAAPLHAGVHATSGDIHIAITGDGATLHVAVTSPDGTRVGHALVVNDDGTTVLRELKDNRVSFSHPEVERIAELKLFA